MSDDTFKVSNGTLRNVHKPEACEGEHCCIHNPSDHAMKDFPMLWRVDRRLMERTCPHGVGHPDPDGLAHLPEWYRKSESVHGCDGCCQREENEDETR